MFTAREHYIVFWSRSSDDCCEDVNLGELESAGEDQVEWAILLAVFERLGNR